MSQPTPEGTQQYPQAPPAYTPPTAEPAPSPVARMRAEVAAEQLPEGVVTVALIPERDGSPAVTVRVLPGLDWSSNAMEAINIGNWNHWASECLYGDDFRRVWLRVNPTNRQVFVFLEELNRVAAMSVGESPASLDSLRYTARP